MKQMARTTHSTHRSQKIPQKTRQQQVKQKMRMKKKTMRVRRFNFELCKFHRKCYRLFAGISSQLKFPQNIRKRNALSSENKENERETTGESARPRPDTSIRTGRCVHRLRSTESFITVADRSLSRVHENRA